MDEILGKLKVAYDLLVQKGNQVTAILEGVQAREIEVAKREAQNTAYESAEVLLANVERIRKENAAASDGIAEERAQFDNWMREERAALANETARLAPLQDREQQLAKDREALEVEKRTFKDRYIAKIKEYVKNTGGVPTSNDIS